MSSSGYYQQPNLVERTPSPLSSANSRNEDCAAAKFTVNAVDGGGGGGGSEWKTRELKKNLKNISGI